jgi:hypothetical protein
MKINEYCEQLRVGGIRAIVGSKSTVWVSHERFSMLRQPTFALHVPDRQEIKDVFRESHAAILSFVVRPSDGWAANSCHYLCTDHEYSLEQLGKGARYDTRRGLSEFEITFLAQSEILKLGQRAYCDTLARTGLSAEHREPFEVAFGRPRPDRRYLGAMKGNHLAAFLVVTEVDDWVSIGGHSADEFLPLRPNNALIYYVVRHYLVERKFRVVDYGLSSIQADSRAEGLHKFKLKMGFDSVAVHRAFVVNPLLRPLANRLSWRLVNGMLKLSPQHPILKKAEGALRMALQRYNG